MYKEIHFNVQNLVGQKWQNFLKLTKIMPAEVINSW